MEVLKFRLRGRSAFFKKPEVNTHYYFTYGNIHKVALLGIFGSILGYKGYNQMTKDDDFPEFYKRLIHLNISIVPNSDNKVIQKKIQTYNNSVGYASKELGGNLIIKEQWLENPDWEIYVKLDCEEARKLAHSLLNKQCVYIPYLGKNDHPANIEEVKIISDASVVNKADFVDSLVPKKSFSFDLDDDDIDKPFKYEEHLPVALDKDMNLYELIPFVYTNLNVIEHQCDVIDVGVKKIVFY